MTPRHLTIVIAGMIAAVPRQGGATWAVLQYLLGLRKLGHHVYFIEPVEPRAFEPPGAPFDTTQNATYFRRVMTEFDFADHSALLVAGTNSTVGLPYSTLKQIAGRADLVINVSGMLTDEQLLAPIPIRVYLDLDPAFNQCWQAVYGIDMRFDGHTHWVTVGLAIGTPECPVPDCGLAWITTFQPVVLDQWPVASSVKYNALTTVANWRGYGSVDFGGQFYGQKAHSLRQFITLPEYTTARFLLALAIHPAEVNDLAALSEHRWQIIDPVQVTATPDDYRSFIQGSWAEFGIAKSGYVVSKCGWFSDRSCCYLAAGRPVIAQDTGFSRYLPTGHGLLAFSTLETAIDGIASLQAEYEHHAQMAREIAGEYFDSDKVLTTLLSRIDAL